MLDPNTSVWDDVPFFLICKEIQYITKLVAAGMIEFGISALSANNCCEFLVLYIKQFGCEVTGSSNGETFVLPVATLSAGVS